MACSTRLRRACRGNYVRVLSAHNSAAHGFPLAAMSDRCLVAALAMPGGVLLAQHLHP